MTQSSLILHHLQAGGTLTVLSALTMFDCYALSQRVSDLRREGHPIKSETIQLESGKRVSKYSWDYDKERVPHG